MAKNYYIILGVDRGAKAGQIKHAYRRIAKQLHPDRFCPSSDPEKFIEAKDRTRWPTSRGGGATTTNCGVRKRCCG